jgi:outer membrane usher protein FimD/PapC
MSSVMPYTHAEMIATQRAELFQSIFQHPEPTVELISAQVTLIIDQKFTTMLNIRFSSQGEVIYIQGIVLCQALSQSLQPKIIQDLLGSVNQDGWLDGYALQDIGIHIHFDSMKRQLYMTTPPNMRNQKIEYINPPKVNPWDLPIIQPAMISAILNYNLKAIHHHDDASTLVSYNLDSALQWHGVVLENFSSGQILPQSIAQHSSTRLVYDSVPNSQRYTIGNLPNLSLSSQLELQPLVGIAVEKYNALQPQRYQENTQQLQFYLEQPAKIEIFNQGNSIYNTTLSAGYHDLRGLVLINGLNDIELHIKYINGRQYIIPFSFFTRPELLPKGMKKYTYQIGWQCAKEKPSCLNKIHSPLFLGQYSNGLMDRLTIGLNTSIQNKDQFLSIKNTIGFNKSALYLEQNIHHHHANKLQFENKINWNYSSDNQDDYQLEPNISIEYRNRLAIDADNLTQTPYQWSLQMGIGIHPFVGGHTQINTYYRKASNNQKNNYGYTVNFNKNINDYIFSIFSIQYNHQHKNDTEYKIGITFKLNKNNINIQSNPSNVNLNWSYLDSTSEYQPEAFLNSTLSPDTYFYDMGVTYHSPIGDLKGSFQKQKAQQNISLAAQGSIVMADNIFALSRRVSDSFIIAKGQKGLNKTPLRINIDQHQHSPYSSLGINPAVLYNLSSYSLKSVRIYPINPPIGSLPKNLEFQAFSRYKTGAVLHIGRPKSFFMIAKLVTPSGAPVSYAKIKLQSIDAIKQNYFSQTSSFGVFSVSELQAGTYYLYINDQLSETPIVIEQQKSSFGVVRLSDITVPMK